MFITDPSISSDKVLPARVRPFKVTSPLTIANPIFFKTALFPLIVNGFEIVITLIPRSENSPLKIKVS